MPPKHENNNSVRNYLHLRGIDPGIVQYCIDNGLLYQDLHGNCVFCGYDENKKPRYGFIRSANTRSVFMQDATGSEKKYSFRMIPNPSYQSIFVFESAIDALSYATLEQMRGSDWQAINYLSISGNPEVNEEGMPLSLAQYLQDNPHVDTVSLCLDNDDTGREMTSSIRMLLMGTHCIINESPVTGKDYNEILQIEKEITAPVAMRMPKSPLKKAHER